MSKQISKIIPGRGCHYTSDTNLDGLKTVAIVGSPNVGKSAIFNVLTGAYAMVSNYPGTTVEIFVGKAEIGGEEAMIVDTPGMYSLLPISEDHKVTRRILFEKRPDIVLQVIEAKSLERMLPLTFELIEGGFSVIVALNIVDEAERIGMKIDLEGLESELGVPVVATIATAGQGIDTLKRRMAELIENRATKSDAKKVGYDQRIESFLEKVEELLTNSYEISKRVVGLLLLQGDEEIRSLVRERESREYESVEMMAEEVRRNYSHPLSYVIGMRRRGQAATITAKVVASPLKGRLSTSDRLSAMMMNPIAGSLILLAVLYFALYQFVGVVGAQILVGFFEEVVFGMYINPFVNSVIITYIPSTIIQELFGGEYGVITLGVRYAVAIILPIVGTFFLVFSVIEDSGYLPRMAMLIDRVFKRIGLNGRAVIPMTLGLGCDTMATVVTRTLETRREKVISTLLLALAVPCSAQLGVLLAILAASPRATLIWAITVLIIFLFVGFLSSQLMPGVRPSFFIEIPPLRMPKLSNVLMKTYTRMEWYFKEVFPLFILASILIWIGRITGLFDTVVDILEVPTRWIGLPDKAAVAFLFGFFRRDYGTAGLFDLQHSGMLSGIPLVVAAVTMTLFVPCIAQFSIAIKERGLKTAISMALFIFPFAFTIGFLLNFLLTTMGVQL